MAKVAFVHVAVMAARTPGRDGGLNYCVIALDQSGQLWQRWWNDLDLRWRDWSRIEAPEEILDAL